MTHLQGKVALVTGGGRGIGAAVARRLAVEGAAIAVTYARSQDRAEALIADIEAGGGRGMAIRADNRDAGAVAAAVAAVATAQGRIDILVNNAGIFETGPIAALTLEDFDRTIDVNLRAVFVATRAAIAHMPDGGRIVSIGSNLAHRVPWPEISLYALSKSALSGFTRGVARDLGSRRICVNLVHPGSTDTEMNPADGEMAQAQRDLMAIGRFNEAAEVAGMVAWLAGPDSGGVTGAEFTIDGGANA